MNQTIRHNKFKAKLSQKTIYKSSLPKLDSVHVLNSKTRQNLPFNHGPLNKTASDRTHASALPFNNKETQYQKTIVVIQKNQNEHQTDIQRNLHQKNLLQTEKQLNTADTFRPEGNGQIQNRNMKEISSQGLDMWNLNNNLKQVHLYQQSQFSQTRKIPFYKAKPSISDNHFQQNPFNTMNKTKTQQINAMYKIYGGGSNKLDYTQRQKSQGQIRFKKFYDPIKKPKVQSRDAKSYSTITKYFVDRFRAQKLIPLENTLYGTLPVRKKSISINTTLYNHDKKPLSDPKQLNFDHSSPNLNPYLKTFINGSHLKREPSNLNIHILEMNTLSMRQTQKQEDSMSKREKKVSNNLRKNRFQKIFKDQIQSNQNDHENLFSDGYAKSLDYEKPQEKSADEKSQEDLNEQRSGSSPLGKTKYNKTQRNAEQKKKIYEYNRCIEKIGKIFLKSSDDYLNQVHTFSSMPASKIQFYIDSLNNPEFNKTTTEYKSTFCGDEAQAVGYDFSFKEPQSTEPQKQKKQAGNSKSKKEQAKPK